MGWEQLFPNLRGPRSRSITAQRRLVDGLFHREYFKQDIYTRFEQEMEGPGIQEDCRVPVGITLTKLHPDTMPLSDIDVSSQRYVSLYEVQAHRVAGAATPSRLVFWQTKAIQDSMWPADQFGQVLALPLVQPDTLNASRTDGNNQARVFELSTASSAFPIAFGPVRLTYCRPDDLDEQGLCSPELAESSYFLDGGVFDNNPLDLAFKMYRYLVDREARHYIEQWCAVQTTAVDSSLWALVRSDSLNKADLRRHLDTLHAQVYTLRKARQTLAAISGQPSIVYVDPRSSRRQFGQDRAYREGEATGIEAFVSFVSGFVPSARQYELAVLLRGLSGSDSEPHMQASIEPALYCDGQVMDIEAVRTRLTQALDTTRTRLERDDATRDTLQHLRSQIAGLPAIDPNRQADIDWVRVTSNFFPIIGGKLGAFAGFIGKPFREFDFYNGVYDATYFIASEYVCGDHGLQQTISQHACYSRVMRELRDSLNLELAGRAVFDMIHGLEFRSGASETMSVQGLPDAILCEALRVPHAASTIDRAVEAMCMALAEDAGGSRYVSREVTSARASASEASDTFQAATSSENGRPTSASSVGPCKAFLLRDLAARADATRAGASEQTPYLEIIQPYLDASKPGGSSSVPMDEAEASLCRLVLFEAMAVVHMRYLETGTFVANPAKRRSGFDDFLTALADYPGEKNETSVRDLIAAWEIPPRYAFDPEKGYADPYDIGPTFKAVIRQPELELSGLLDQGLQQLHRVEDGRPYESYAKGVHFAYRIYRISQEPGLWWSSSIPPVRNQWSRRFIKRVVPYEVSLSTYWTELGWRPVWQCCKGRGRPLKLAGASVGVTIPFVLRSNVVNQIIDEPVYALSGGVGVLLRRQNMVLNGIEVNAQVMRHGSDWVRADAHSELLIEVALYALAERIRIGASFNILDHELFNQKRAVVSVGLADVNGLVYWLLR